MISSLLKKVVNLHKYIRMKKIITVVCMWVVIIALTTNCAKRGTPTGGAKDTIPPVLLDANPKQGTTNFKNKSIRLTFDEFVKLKDIQKQLIVSPPLTLFPVLFASMFSLPVLI